MAKKYVIASDEKQLNKNMDYFINNRSKVLSKSIIQRIKELIIWIWMYYTEGLRFDSLNNQLYKLLAEEIELFYLNNFMDQKDIQIKCSFNTKRQEKRIGIKLPIILSIISSFIYTYLSQFLNENFMNDLIIPFIQICKLFYENLLNNPAWETGVSIIYKSVLYLLLLTSVIILIILITIIIYWLVIKFFVLFLGEMNFEKNVISEYENKFMDRICEENNYIMYIEVIELLNAFEEKFFACIDLLSYNYMLKNNKECETIVVLEQEAEKVLLNNPILEKFDEYCCLWNKKILLKSLIYRVYRNINDKSTKLMLKEDKVYIKNVNMFL